MGHHFFRHLGLKIAYHPDGRGQYRMKMVEWRGRHMGSVALPGMGRTTCLADALMLWDSHKIGHLNSSWLRWVLERLTNEDLITRLLRNETPLVSE